MAFTCPPRREGGDFNLKDSTLTLKNTGGTGLNIGSYKKLIIDNATVTMEPTAPSGGRALGVGSHFASVVGMDSETLTLVEGVILNLGGIKIFNDRGVVYNGRDDVTVTAENGPATNETLTAGDYVWDGTCFAKGGGYDGDVAAFGAILDAHPSLVSGDVSRDDPESWINAGVIWQDYPKRITGLDLTNKGLTGTLDVSGLTALTSLQCANNELTDLIGLESLTKLGGLYCANNELTDLTGLGSLMNLVILDCANNPYTTFTTRAGHTLTVVPFAGGKVWMTGYDMEDHAVELTARPDSGYTFQKWTDLPEGAASDGNTASFTLSGNVTVEAIFEDIPAVNHTITASAGTGGSITPSGSVTVPDGGSMTFAIAANRNYRINRVLVDGADQGAIASYTFSNVTGNHAISAEFTYIGGSSGGGSSSGSSSDGGSGSAGSTQGTTAMDTKKGVVNSVTGIVTGSGDGHSDWQQETAPDGSIVWRLRYADGTYAAGAIVAEADGTTCEQPAWELINGGWYPFGADGYARSGMVFDLALGGYFYIDINTGMKTGWQLIDGKWYYFNPVSDGRKGIMFVDTWVDGCYVDKNGIWEEGRRKE